MKKTISVLVVLVLALSFGACKKKEEKSQLPGGHPGAQGSMSPGAMPNAPKVQRTVVVSKEVASKWKAVKLAVENKASKTTKEYSINIGSELAVPGTAIKVKILSFLPDFKMSDKEFYSASEKPNQPAVQIAVTESGKEVFNNWLFSMQPGVHPFQHPSIGLVLLGGVSK